MWKNLLMLLLLLAFCTAGCQKQYVEKTSGAAYQVVDSQGNVIKFAQKPQRIMTTHFNLDNIVMGLVDEERVVALSKSMYDASVSYISTEAIKKPTKLNYDFSSEQVLALKPDLIIARESTGENRIQTYRAMGIPVYVVSNANNVEEIKKQIQEIGQAVGESERAEKLQQRMQTQLDYIKSKVDSASIKPKSVMLVSKMNHNYGGKGSFFDDMCHFAGVKNAPAEIGVLNGQLMDKEIMLRAAPDYFLLSLSWELKHDNKDGYKKEFLEDPALANLEAVKNNHVCYLLGLDSDTFYIYHVAAVMVDNLRRLLLGINLSDKAIMDFDFPGVGFPV